MMERRFFVTVRTAERDQELSELLRDRLQRLPDMTVTLELRVHPDVVYTELRRHINTTQLFMPSDSHGPSKFPLRPKEYPGSKTDRLIVEMVGYAPDYDGSPVQFEPVPVDVVLDKVPVELLTVEPGYSTKVTPSLMHLVSSESDTGPFLEEDGGDEGQFELPPERVQSVLTEMREVLKSNSVPDQRTLLRKVLVDMAMGQTNGTLTLTFALSEVTGLCKMPQGNSSIRTVI